MCTLANSDCTVLAIDIATMYLDGIMDHPGPGVNVVTSLRSGSLKREIGKLATMPSFATKLSAPIQLRDSMRLVVLWSSSHVKWFHCCVELQGNEWKLNLYDREF